MFLQDCFYKMHICLHQCSWFWSSFYRFAKSAAAFLERNAKSCQGPKLKAESMIVNIFCHSWIYDRIFNRGSWLKTVPNAHSFQKKFSNISLHSDTLMRRSTGLTDVVVVTLQTLPLSVFLKNYISNFKNQYSGPRDLTTCRLQSRSYYCKWHWRGWLSW